jgi:hypothetical protein
MDLREFIAHSRKVIIMSPRFVNSRKIADVISKALASEKSKIGRVDSSIVHELHTLKGYDILIYENAFNALHQLSVNDNSNKVVIVEWGTESETLIDIVKWATVPRKPVAILTIGFMPEMRKVKYDSIEIAMSPEHNKWYQMITGSSTSLDIKNKAGNHFFSGLTATGNMILLKNDHLIPSNKQNLHKNFESDLNKSSKNISNPHITTLKELLGDKMDRLIEEEEIIGRISELVTPDPNQRNFFKHSPKLAMILSEFKKNAGKYVIFTNYSKSSGVELISETSKLFFDAAPLLLTLDTFKDEDQIVNKFNKSKTHILITTIVPNRPLKGVDVLVIFDTFLPETIYSITSACCSAGCGKEGSPLQVPLLNVISPDEKEETLEQNTVKSAFGRMEGWDAVYKSYEKGSKSILTKGASLVVADPKR